MLLQLNHRKSQGYLELVGSSPGSENDASAICFVSGYIGRSICYRRKCPGCKELLVEVWWLRTSRMCAERACPTFRNCWSWWSFSTNTALFRDNRDWRATIYISLVSNEHVKNFVTLFNQRSVFTTAVCEVATNGLRVTLLQQQCSVGHFIFKLIT